MNERLHRIRRDAGALVVDSFFRGASRLGRMHPQAAPEKHGIAVTRNVAYGDADHPARILDVYRPRGGASPRTGLRPALLYVHGGGFRILSKDTHWIMALAYARRGYVVFNVDYRLAPTHRFPAAVEDVCAAYAWVVANAARYGADADQLVLAGESAGANLVASLAIAACYARPEPHAKAVFDTGVVPRAVLPACGMHQVTDAARFSRRKSALPRVIADRIEEVTEAYLGAGRAQLHVEGLHDLADPVVFFERGTAPDRPLPAFFLPVGTADPLLDDTRRLARALRALGVDVDERYYEGEIHAFHAFVFRPNARLHWADTYAFLDRVLGAPRVQSRRSVARGAESPDPLDVRVAP